MLASRAVRATFSRATHVNEPTFGSLLYRYWFFGWLFRDVNCHGARERAEAWRHNQAHARWLPTYLRRWGFLGVACFLAGLGMEPLLSPLAQAAFYVPSAISLSINAVTLAAWVGLRCLPGPA